MDCEYDMMDQKQTCENCGHGPLESFVVRPNQTFWHCTECDLYQKGRLPTETSYEADYHSEYAEQRGRKLTTAAIRLSAIARHVDRPHPKTLDIGCSVGAIVEAANNMDWHGVGVDVSQTAVDFCRSRGLDCHVIDGLKLPFADDTFDVVTSWHVIEHVLDVARTLQEWYRVLKPGGVMVLETPDASCLKARMQGARYAKFWAVEHIYTFRRRNLVPFLEQAGFEMLANPVVGRLSLLPPTVAGYSLLYRGLKGVSRRMSLSKSFEVYCRKPSAMAKSSRAA